MAEDTVTERIRRKSEHDEKPRLWHVTARNRLGSIMRNGLSPSATPLSDQNLLEELHEMGVENPEKQMRRGSPAAEAESDLNEELYRYDNVYLWTTKRKAMGSMTGLSDLPYRLVILEVAPGEIPCQCTAADAEIADTIFDKFYKARVHEWMVDMDEIYELVDDYEETEERYRPGEDYPSYYEVYCPCTIPRDAIVGVYDESGEWISRGPLGFERPFGGGPLVR